MIYYVYPHVSIFFPQVNESALTGESDDISKQEKSHAAMLLSGSQVCTWILCTLAETLCVLMVSHAQVAGGNGAYVVTAVGSRSMQGSIMEDASAEESETPLQAGCTPYLLKYA
jgi:magnesium-transporting ATPase (P-type)